MAKKKKQVSTTTDTTQSVAIPMMMDVSQFMDNISFDVLNYILSFLPPIPHLFLLQRVNQNWRELCKLCMEQDVRVITWSGVMTYDPNHVASEHLRIQTILFQNFSNIRTLELTRIVINMDILTQCSSHIPQLENLSFVQCSFQMELTLSSIPPRNKIKNYLDDWQQQDLNPPQILSDNGGDNDNDDDTGTSSKYDWAAIAPLQYVFGRMAVPIDQGKKKANLNKKWKSSLKKLSLKCCSFNYMTTSANNPLSMSAYRALELYFLVGSLVLALPNVQLVDVRFAQKSDISAIQQGKSLEELFQYFDLPTKVNYLCPRLLYSEQFGLQFPFGFEKTKAEEEMDRALKFSNEYWKDVLCTEFKFSRQRMNILCEKYYSCRFKDHEVLLDDLLKEGRVALNYNLLFESYSSKSDLAGYYSGPTMESVYDLGYVADALIEFLNQNPYYSIDSDLADEGGYNLIQQATNFYNFEVLLFLLRYFNEYRKERKQESRRVFGTNEQNEKWIDEQYLQMFKKRCYSGKSAVHSCFSGNRSNFQLYSLLRYGADVNYLNKRGETITHELAKYGQIRTIQTVLSHKDKIAAQVALQEPDDTMLNTKSTSYILDFNVRNSENDTPVHAAIKSSMYFTFEEMLKLPNVDLKLKDASDLTYRDYQNRLEEARREVEEQKRKQEEQKSPKSTTSTPQPQPSSIPPPSTTSSSGWCIIS